MEEVANPIAKASFDRVEPAVEKMCRLGFRLRQARRRAIARHGVISAGVPTPESLVGPSWRLRRLQFPTTPATAPSVFLGIPCCRVPLNVLRGSTTWRPAWPEPNFLNGRLRVFIFKWPDWGGRWEMGFMDVEVSWVGPGVPAPSALRRLAPSG